ncbi:biotin/lipoyl-containing protein [Akkermansia muciniphila]|uniref:biotin/lipoyl-containing protein n=1 Tax=Akkermansia muciniphila TaxID=239935 RepID=UPI001BFF4AAD|nr:acetyl-CoA carboxylase biotin carboxyl carrier protein subunit [Akkermansia muciniphila]
MKKLRITVDGKVFDVSVELLDQVSSTTSAPAPAPVAAPAPAASAPVAAPAPAPAPAAAPAAAGAGDVPSPLAGKVVSLDVAPGTAVKAGDQILTLEAMKMNTIIYAPSAGTLTAFCVSAGDTVQEGQALAKIG